MIFGFCDSCHGILQENGGGHFAYCDIVQEEVRKLATTLREIPMTVPTQEDFWSSMTVHAVDRLRAPKVAPVPDAIVKLAQTSYEGVMDPSNPEGERYHVLRHTFDTEERAAAFFKLIKKAGAHTTPMTSVTAVVDPDNLHEAHGRNVYRQETGSDATDAELIELGGRTVAWKSGVRRGKK